MKYLFHICSPSRADKISLLAVVDGVERGNGLCEYVEEWRKEKERKEVDRMSSFNLSFYKSIAFDWISKHFQKCV